MTVWNVQTVSLRHENGTKFYHLTMVANRDTRKSLIIRRWGKVRSRGKHRIVQFISDEPAVKHLHDIRDQKMARGYTSIEPGVNEEVTSEDSLRVILVNQIGTILSENDYRHLGMTGETRFDQTPEYSLESFSTERSILTVEEQIARNPNWGIF